MTYKKDVQIILRTVHRLYGAITYGLLLQQLSSGTLLALLVALIKGSITQLYLKEVLTYRTTDFQKNTLEGSFIPRAYTFMVPSSNLSSKFTWWNSEIMLNLQHLDKPGG